MMQGNATAGAVIGAPAGQVQAAPKPPSTTQAQQAFAYMEGVMRARLIEREDAIRATLIALALKEHAVFLGPPGTSKSAMVDLLCRMIDLPAGGLFSYLMTKETSQAELFGPFSFQAMKADRLQRHTTGRVPEAVVAFLDEVFKSNSAILNALLRLMNEGHFDFGDGVPRAVPLRSVYGASNEFPAGDDLDAYFDRFLLRDIVAPIQSLDARRKYLNNCAAGVTARVLFSYPAKSRVPLALIESAASEICDTLSDTGQVASRGIITMSVGMVNHAIEIMDALAAKGVVMSDRRQGKAMQVIRAHAWMEGRTEVAGLDLRALRWVAWSTASERTTVLSVLDDKVPDLLGKVTQALRNAESVVREVLIAQQAGRPVANHETNEKLKRALAEAQNAAASVPASGPGERERAMAIVRQIEQMGVEHQQRMLADTGIGAKDDDDADDVLDGMARVSKSLGGGP